MEIIPAINCHAKDNGCVKEKLEAASGFLKNGDWLHLDIADGRFTFNKTWNDPTFWANLRPKFKLEVHFMVENPEKYLSDWLAAGAERFIIHKETISENTARSIVNFLGNKRRGVMLASEPHTTTAELWPYLKHFSSFQVLAVNPGLAGQKFLPTVLRKIKFLRNFAPSAKIEVDGGINLETGKLAAAAGANVFVSASYIFGSANPKKAYENLKKMVN